MRFHSILDTTAFFGFIALGACSSPPGTGTTGQNTMTGGAAGMTTTSPAGSGSGVASGGMASAMGGSTTMAGAAPTGVAGMTSAGGAVMMGGAGMASGGASAGMGGASMGGASMGGASANAGSGGASPMGGSGGGGEGGGGAGMGGEGGSGVGGAPAGGEFTMTSEELTEGESFAAANTCDGGGGELNFGVSVSLEWSGFPAETQSFALTMIDVTLVDGQAMDYLGCHSFFHDLPVDVTSLPAGGWGDALSEAGATAFRTGYLGPCPPNGPDTYELTLYALPDASFTPEGNMNSLSGCNMLRESLEEAALDKVTLSGTYVRP